MHMTLHKFLLSSSVGLYITEKYLFSIYYLLGLHLIERLPGRSKIMSRKEQGELKAKKKWTEAEGETFHPNPGNDALIGEEE